MDKSRFYHPFGLPDEYNLFSVPSIAAHAKVRRPLAQLCSQTTLLSYEPFVNTFNAILLKRLDEFAHNVAKPSFRAVIKRRVQKAE